MIDQASYVLGEGQVLAQTRSGATSYYLYDGQGSVRTLTNSSGSITDQYSYDAFGTLLSSQGSTVNPYRYTGQQFDSLTGLYDLRARYYDPTTGQFTSRDTAGIDVNNPVELNRYSYAQENPVNLSDPSGHFAVETAVQEEETVQEEEVVLPPEKTWIDQLLEDIIQTLAQALIDLFPQPEQVFGPGTGPQIGPQPAPQPQPGNPPSGSPSPTPGNDTYIYRKELYSGPKAVERPIGLVVSRSLLARSQARLI